MNKRSTHPQKKAAPATGPVPLHVFLRENGLNLLLVFLPLAVVLELRQAPETWVFLTSALAIIPLAGLIGQATEELAERVGPALGGFLNATFGNATELIIALLALQRGLHEVVKASISGSIIGNILLVLGLSMFAGGMGRETQRFSRTAAGASAAMLFLAVVALVMPAIFHANIHTADLRLREGQLSLLVSGVLLLIYLASLIFSLVTHKSLFAPREATAHTARLTTPNALILLAASTVLTAVMAEFLVGSIDGATRALGMTEFFVGVIVVAVIGNAAEHFTAILMARKNKMDLAVGICTGSSTQIALLVAPVLVFASYLFGRPMSLVFNSFEVLAIALSVIALSVVCLDGESNWFEGLQLTAVYVILGIVFYFVPA